MMNEIQRKGNIATTTLEIVKCAISEMVSKECTASTLNWANLKPSGASIKKIVTMEENNLAKVYEQLRKSGYTNVDHIIKWMQLANIIDHTQISERRVRVLFGGREKEVQVDFQKFQDVVERMALENKKLVEDVTQILATEGPKMMAALEAAAKAYEEKNKK